MKRLMLQLPSFFSICSPCRQRLSQTFAFQSPRNPNFPKRLITTTPNNLADSSFDSTFDFPELPNQKSKLSPPTRFKKPHRLHVHATKHNTRLTLTRGNRETLITVTTGNIGFRKARRGTYDAAYQLGTFMMGRINNEGLLAPEYPGKGGPIEQLEVVLRDFGPGREAVTKILLGAEGRALRERVARVMDSTRLKHGGTRSKKPRRLG